MIRIGDYNTLEVQRSTSVGVFLSDDEGTEILLPNKYVPEGIQLRQQLEVFCYLDHQERPVATTLRPLIKRDGFGYLQCVATSEFGAFLDWGLEKQLFVPFREQRDRMRVGKAYVVHCYLDKKSFRLAATSKIEGFLKEFDQSLEENQEVKLLIYRDTELGWEVIINESFKGLLYGNDIYKTIALGDTVTGFIKKIREDKKLDVSLLPTGASALDINANYVYQRLLASDGFIPLHDRSSPEAIKAELQLSKKAFKKAIGILYKQQKILLQENGILLIDGQGPKEKQ